jgi:hypothetical protein
MPQVLTRTKKEFEVEDEEMIEDRSVLARAARTIAASRQLLERLGALGPVQSSDQHAARLQQTPSQPVPDVKRPGAQRHGEESTPDKGAQPRCPSVGHPPIPVLSVKSYHNKREQHLHGAHHARKTGGAEHRRGPQGAG